MTEDTGILLVAGGIAGNLTHFYVVAGKGRIVQHHAVLAVEILLTRIQGFLHHAVLKSDTGHGAEALTLDEDLAFFILLTTNLITIEIICTQIPVAVPAVLLDSLNHCVNTTLSAFGLLILCNLFAKFYILLTCQHEQAGNHQRFCL